MNTFIQKYASHVKGVLSGFDRLVFRGTLRVLSVVGGMMNYLWHMHVLLKDFGPYAEAVTQTVHIRKPKGSPLPAGGYGPPGGWEPDRR